MLGESWRTRGLTRGILFAHVACIAWITGACTERGVTPVQPVAVGLRVYPTGNFAFNIGETFLFSARLIATDSTDLGPATAATWTSSDTAVATITTDGHFRSRCAGVAIIRATQADGARTLSGERSVPVLTTGPRCASPNISTETRAER